MTIVKNEKWIILRARVDKLESLARKYEDLAAEYVHLGLDDMARHYELEAGRNYRIVRELESGEI